MANDIGEKAKEYTNFRIVVLTSIISALGFVLALFWNDAVRSAIEQILPRADTVTAKFVTAIIVTIIVVIIMYILLKSHRLAEERIKKLAAKPIRKS